MLNDLILLNDHTSPSQWFGVLNKDIRVGSNNSTLQIGVGGRGFAIKSTSFGEVFDAIPDFFQPESGANLTNG
jgi:hypothetical protein